MNILNPAPNNFPEIFLLRIICFIIWLLLIQSWNTAADSLGNERWGESLGYDDLEETRETYFGEV
jgi:hypothetical protein